MKMLHIRLPDELLQRVKAEAKRLNISVTDYVRMVLSGKVGE